MTQKANISISFLFCDFEQKQIFVSFSILTLHTVFPHIIAAATILFWNFQTLKISNTVFPHIIAAATILFWIHLVRKLFKFSFPLCNENLNSFLTRWGNYSRRGNYSREETIWGNTVFYFEEFKYLVKHFPDSPFTPCRFKNE